MVSSLPISKHINQPLNHFKNFFEKEKRCCTALPLNREVPDAVDEQWPMTTIDDTPKIHGYFLGKTTK